MYLINAPMHLCKRTYAPMHRLSLSCSPSNIICPPLALSVIFKERGRAQTHSAVIKPGYHHDNTSPPLRLRPSPRFSSSLTPLPSGPPYTPLPDSGPPSPLLPFRVFLHADRDLLPPSSLLPHFLWPVKFFRPRGVGLFSRKL